MALLDDVVISAPCPMSWEAMEGNDTVRHCGGCAKNVYNIADMTEREAEQFFQQNGANQCIRLFRRNDGKMMTDNCPRGLRAIRNKMRLMVKIGAGVAASIFAFVPAWRGTPANAQQAPDLKGDVYIPPKKDPAAAKSVDLRPLSGEAMIKTPTVESKGNMMISPAKPAKHVMMGGECPSQAKPATKVTTPGVMGQAVAPPAAPATPAIEPALQGRFVITPQKTTPTKNGDPKIQSPDTGVVKKDRTNKKSDSNAHTIYLRAYENELRGNLLIASVQYKEAIAAAKLQKHGDPKFLQMLINASDELSKKLA